MDPLMLFFLMNVTCLCSYLFYSFVFFFYSIMKEKTKIKPIVQNQIDFWEVLGHRVIVILIHLTHVEWWSNYPESQI